MKKVISMVLCLMIVLTFVASSFAISIVKVTGVNVDKTSLTLDAGGSYGLVITLSPVNTTQKLLTFTTSDANIAKVDIKGKITAVKAGKATITVTSVSNSKVIAKCTVTVKKKALVVLRVEVYDRGNTGGTSPDNNYWTKWIQANYGNKNNVTVKFETSPRFDNNAKLQMWMAAGTAPDICYTNEIAPVDNFRKNGGLADITAALKQYGTELKAFLGDYLLNKGVDVKNGQQYKLVARKAIDANETSWIRQDWLEALNLPMPKTVDEWYNAMKLFKLKNPGKVDRVVPYVLGADVGWQAQGLIEAFKTDKTDLTRYVTNGRYLQLYAPGVKDGIRFLNKMYNEGLISPEFALDTQSGTYHSDIINGKGGFMTNNYDYPLRSPSPGLIAGLVKNIPTAKLIPCQPFMDKNGKYTQSISDIAGISIFVPKTSQDKVGEVIKYLNWMSDPAVLFFLQYGKEGKNHKMNNGIPQVIPATGETVQNSPNNIDYTMVVNGVMGKDKDDTILRNSLAYSGDMRKYYADAWKTGIVDGYLGPQNRLNELPAADAIYGNVMATKANEVYAKTITAKPADFDKVWDEQILSMSRAGAGKMISERRTLWTKYYPAK